MPELLVVVVAGLVVIAAATVVGPRLGIAAPLVLVAIGVIASLLSVFSRTHIEPDVILAGFLPRAASGDLPEPPHPEGEPSREAFEVARQHRLAVLQAQRAALLDARSNGTFDAEVLDNALRNLDASQIDLELRGQFFA